MYGHAITLYNSVPLIFIDKIELVKLIKAFHFMRLPATRCELSVDKVVLLVFSSQSVNYSVHSFVRQFG